MEAYHNDGEGRGHRSIDNTPHPCAGPSTYLHAGSAIGWPFDHSVEDTYDVPPPNDAVKINAAVEGACYPEGVQRDLSELKARSAFFHNLMSKEKPQYGAEYTGTGGVVLVLYTPARTIANFNTYDDAMTAAKALNNHHGY